MSLSANLRNGTTIKKLESSDKNIPYGIPGLTSARKGCAVSTATEGVKQDGL